MKIIGEVTSDEELYLDGDLDGKLNLRNRLTVGPNSKVNANIKAKEIIVFGTIKGNVESESRVSLRTGASIVGRYQDRRYRDRGWCIFQGWYRYLPRRRRRQDRSQSPKARQQARSASKNLMRISCWQQFCYFTRPTNEAAPSAMRNM